MGILAEENRRIFFQYTPEFIAEGIDVSPFKLHLLSRLHAYELLFHQNL